MEHTALQNLPERSDRRFYVFNAVLSVSALAFLAYILLIHRGTAAGYDLSFLPAVNASLNATAALLLCAGYVFIRRKAITLHKYCMVSAFAASTLFLICYVVYHLAHGHTEFPRTSPIRHVYYFILGSHVLLSMLVVPLSLTTLYLAARKSFRKHRRIARITLPIWFYVSVTGVAVFFLLRLS